MGHPAPADATATPTRPAPVRYIGLRDARGVHVWIERDGVRELVPSDEAGTALEWSLTGPTASALARVVLRDATGSPALAGRFYRRLTFDVIASLPERGFELTDGDIVEWLGRVDAP